MFELILFLVTYTSLMICNIKIFVIDDEVRGLPFYIWSVIVTFSISVLITFALSWIIHAII